MCAKLNPLKEMIRLKDKFNELMYSEMFNDYREFYIEAELLDKDIVLNPMSSLRTRFPNILSVRQTGSNDIDSSERIDVLETEEESIENDFINFHRYIHEENPRVDKLTLFSEIQMDCEKNETVSSKTFDFILTVNCFNAIAKLFVPRLFADARAAMPSLRCPELIYASGFRALNLVMMGSNTADDDSPLG